jgi:nucleotide-binding universal stress UspA family protein
MSVLVAVDFSSVTAKQLDAVRELAKGRTLEVYLIHVAAPNPDFVGYQAGPDVVLDQVAEEFRREHGQLEELTAELSSDTIDVTPVLVPGSTVDTLLDEARRLGVGLLVVGSHGHGAAYDLVVGGFSSKIIKKSPVPVLVVPARGV